MKKLIAAHSNANSVCFEVWELHSHNKVSPNPPPPPSRYTHIKIFKKKKLNFSLVIATHSSANTIYFEVWELHSHNKASPCLLTLVERAGLALR